VGRVEVAEVGEGFNKELVVMRQFSNTYLRG
jgi:hypothetical protein